ncbi:hypothetical protein [Clostridium tyrobutyricum]|uniref:hypothetical protein n=1 Tax=Clostridium tyrobutyricum TaxID=1519 RepID=UPI001C382979|nr:hypothetical protein [Clostridium tyrobutyricum]MBV4428566.1 hypothetical protein [Clostridium tyrobutyricum]MBV4443049.1 hypothetical protein [Clostridium tyrobutyricum]
MRELVISQIIIPIIAAFIGAVLEIARRQFKAYLDSEENFIKKKQEALQQSMKIEEYNKDKQIVCDAVKAVEQLGRESHWKSTMKHSKVLEIIKDKTSLTDDEIFNIIKGAVLEVNQYRKKELVEENKQISDN